MPGVSVDTDCLKRTAISVSAGQRRCGGRGRFEPAASSVSAMTGEALCYPAFPQLGSVRKRGREGSLLGDHLLNRRNRPRAMPSCDFAAFPRLKPAKGDGLFYSSAQVSSSSTPIRFVSNTQYVCWLATSPSGGSRAGHGARPRYQSLLVVVTALCCRVQQSGPWTAHESSGAGRRTTSSLPKVSAQLSSASTSRGSLLSSKVLSCSGCSPTRSSLSPWTPRWLLRWSCRSVGCGAAVRLAGEARSDTSLRGLPWRAWLQARPSIRSCA